MQIYCTRTFHFDPRGLLISCSVIKADTRAQITTDIVASKSIDLEHFRVRLFGQVIHPSSTPTATYFSNNRLGD